MQLHINKNTSKIKHNHCNFSMQPIITKYKTTLINNKNKNNINQTAKIIKISQQNDINVFTTQLSFATNQFDHFKFFGIYKSLCNFFKRKHKIMPIIVFICENEIGSFLLFGLTTHAR
ncbi:hypothetical protein RFI_32774 [Reticulomyxa filosa]|uniref:Uncharacterized protein n=1 Tax=Reticulomyxa filosa TaxID=46433 RepID=X6LRV2_RETFI|nr:hypothetical protein RFI_32774 [Reticulomyxa filosa]|eukprot:ETO04623.1 hypothetical protein RFI_32774 [Reticulomyxa filosa]